LFWLLQSVGYCCPWLPNRSSSLSCSGDIVILEHDRFAVFDDGDPTQWFYLWVEFAGVFRGLPLPALLSPFRAFH
jgi:hypothetical protein